MPFTSGRLTFCQFAVTGDAPTSADETAISILNEHAFKETPIGAPDEVEAGFVTGEHILDTQFTYEKNGFGDALLFAIRIDTHKVPSDLKQAYRKINERAAAADNPSGFASKAQKRDAKDEAERQLHDDLASGKFRRSKMVQILWDLSTQTVYCGATGSTVLEQVARLFKSAFTVSLQYQSAGTLAGRLLRGTGMGRDYEDLRPSAFTKPPAGATADQDDADYIEGTGGPQDMTTPMVPWVVKSIDLKDFLGNEFLFWLWWLSETDDGALTLKDKAGQETEVFFAIDKALDMDCAWDAGGKQTLRGAGPTRLIEAGDALKTGKWPRKMGLILSDGEHQWELTFQGDLWSVSAALLPQIEDAPGPREQLEQRLHLARALAATLDGMYRAFLATRTSGSWPTRRSEIRRWVADRLHSQEPQPQTLKEKPQFAEVIG